MAKKPRPGEPDTPDKKTRVAGRKPTFLVGATKEDLRLVAIEDLERSGLDEKDFWRLKLEILDKDETDDFVGEPRASYRIPYFDLRGKRIAYARVRFLHGKSSTRGFRDNKHSSFRYSQPAGSSPHIYYPPYLDWKKIAKDPSIPILITEGEKKAAKACKEGIACIALGGVWAFKSSKRSQDILPAFDEIEWKGREVEICYDADVMLKYEVRQALQVLTAELSNRYGPASISLVFLDAETAGPKTGLDDYLVANGAEAFAALPRHEHKATAQVQELNQHICYVSRVARFYDIDQRIFYKSFWHLREAYMDRGEALVDAKKSALVVDLWGKSTSRRVVRDVVYIPGLSEDTTEDGDLNTWVAPKTSPRKGTPKLWLDLVHHIMRKPEYAEWFLRWLAYPVQNPGAKLLTAVFVHGLKQGVGKTFVVDPVMEHIYGKDNFYRLSNDDLQSEFNAYTSHTQFVVTNEIYLTEARDRRMMMSRLKDMVTREKVTVNEKYQPKMVFPDRCNYYFTSNHADALILDPADRRFFVIEAPEENLGRGVYEELDEWVREKDGASVLLHYLQNSVDVSSFNPREAALMTPYKKALIGLSKDILTEFAEALVSDPQEVFMHDGLLPDLQLFKASDLVKLFETKNPKYRMSLSSNKMARLLTEVGLERRKVRLEHDAPQYTLYAMFEREHWREARNSEWAAHYLEHHRRYGKSRLR